MRPGHAGAATTLAAVLMLREDYATALALADVALAENPDHPEALGNRGICLHRLGRSREAVPVLERAIALKP